jgi:uncharacterized protein YtpQ (UPF0354 family)
MVTFAEYDPAARPVELNNNVSVAGELEVTVPAEDVKLSHDVVELEVYEVLAE